MEGVGYDCGDVGRPKLELSLTTWTYPPNALGVS